MTQIHTSNVSPTSEGEYTTDPKFKGGDNSKCVVCSTDLGSATFGKVCMRCHDEMIKRGC